MQWTALILGFVFLLGAEGPLAHCQVREGVPAGEALERKWRTAQRVVKDNWIRLQALAAGEEVVL